MARLGDVATYINGYAFRPSDWSDTGLPIIRIQDLTGNSYQANRYSGEYDKKYEVLTGDVLISWSASLGVFVWQGEKAVLNQHIFKVVFDKVPVNKSFFIHQVDNILANASSETHGATMKHLTKPVFDALPFYLPDKKKQEEIAAVLDKVSDLIALRKQQLAKLDELVKARFVEMFGDIKINPYGFGKKPLKETCTVVTGNTPSRSVPEYYGDSVEWIKTDNIVAGQLYPSQAIEYLSDEGMKAGRTVEKGTILMACIAGSIASIGRVCITNRKVAFNQQINAIIPKEYNLLFLHVMLQLSKEYLVAEINMALKGILSKSKLEGKMFIVPPMDDQKRFASFVAQVDKSKSVVQSSLDKLETLNSALMQEYFG